MHQWHYTTRSKQAPIISHEATKLQSSTLESTHQVNDRREENPGLAASWSAHRAMKLAYGHPLLAQDSGPGSFPRSTGRLVPGYQLIVIFNMCFALLVPAPA